jgi:hypothetical protein
MVWVAHLIALVNVSLCEVTAWPEECPSFPIPLLRDLGSLRERSPTRLYNAESSVRRSEGDPWPGLHW